MDRPPSQSKGENVTEIAVKKTPVLLMIFFVVITFAIYLPVWFLRRRATINRLESDEKLGAGVFVFAIVALSITLVMALVSETLVVVAEETLDAGLMDSAYVLDQVTKPIDLVVGLTLLVQAFKVRRIFGEHFNTHLKQDIVFSGPATFFFWIFYLQYKINRFDYRPHIGPVRAADNVVGTPAGIDAHAA